MAGAAAAATAEGEVSWTSSQAVDASSLLGAGITAATEGEVSRSSSSQAVGVSSVVAAMLPKDSRREGAACGVANGLGVELLNDRHRIALLKPEPTLAELS